MGKSPPSAVHLELLFENGGPVRLTQTWTLLGSHWFARRAWWQTKDLQLPICASQLLLSEPPLQELTGDQSESLGSLALLLALELPFLHVIALCACVEADADCESGAAFG